MLRFFVLLETMMSNTTTIPMLIDERIGKPAQEVADIEEIKPRAIIKPHHDGERSGMRLMLLSTHSRFHSLLWFFFITMGTQEVVL